MLLSQALASAASVGVTCGAGCGSAAFGFLSSYILSRGKGWSSALRQTMSFFLGKLLAVLLVCAFSSALGTALIDAENELLSAILHKAVYAVMLISALWLLFDLRREEKGCKACRHCEHSKPAAPSFAVGFAYGVSPCAPLLMVMGYSALLSLPGALFLGIVFAASSSLVPILLTLTLTGALSAQISKQLGVWMPRFRLAVYLLFLISAIVGLFT